MTPDEFTIAERTINVSDGHKLYTQFWGNKDARQAIVFLHGGPGSGCSDKQKSMFDPVRHKVVFIDQRGSGKSLPYGSLAANDTDHLMDDISIVADAYDLSTFAIIGGSWGSTLALAYALKNPGRVTAMVLRGIFTGREAEMNFMDKGEFRSFFPDVWAAFVASVPKEHAADPGAYHMPRTLGADPVAAKQSAFAYSNLEGAVVSLDDRQYPASFDEFDPTQTIIECHYLANKCFLPEGYLLNNAAKLTMPIHFVQGRYDAICPPSTAYELSQKLPNASLHWTAAGHSGNDRANWEVVKALLSQLT